jgi:hypothetical protein
MKRAQLGASTSFSRLLLSNSNMAPQQHHHHHHQHHHHRRVFSSVLEMEGQLQKQKNM